MTDARFPKIPRVPISLFISITSKCNLSCRHCSVYSDRLDYGPDLTTEQWLGFIDEIARLKIFRVKISGGEPFVREDIFDILDAIYGKPVRFSINTNAIFIDAPKARRLAGYLDKLDDVMVSLDGADAPTYEALRGKGTFDRAMGGIRELVCHVGKICAYCTVNRYNCRELEKIARLAKDTGIGSLKFNELLKGGRGQKYYAELGLNKKEKIRIMGELKEMQREYPFISGTLLQTEEIFSNIRSRMQQKQGDSFYAEPCLSGCGALLQECAIGPDGRVTPCDRLPEFTAGHILRTPLDRIWRDAVKFQEFRKRFATHLSDLDTCGSCEYIPYCTGGCPASAWPVYGSLLAADPTCCYRNFQKEYGERCK